jgi:glycosyltransferase involved in cell wall biosynthesis
MMKKLSILIPTRNRLKLLKNTLKFIENIKLKNIYIKVVISDNSDIEYEKIYSTLDIKIIRPPSCLAMPLHWEWMLTQVESDFYCILTDRSLLFEENFTEAMMVLESNTKELISYSYAGYSDHLFPFFVGGLGYSNTNRIISSESILSEAKMSHYWAAFPRALNCIFTHQVVTVLRVKYGNVFGGVAPDINFAFKYLSSFDDFLFLDKPVFLSVGMTYSQGRKTLKGESTDLTKWAINNSPWEESKIKTLPTFSEVTTPINCITHEMADVHGLDGFSFDHFYNKISEEKSNHSQYSFLNIISIIKKIARPFTIVKSYKFAIFLASTCFNKTEMKKTYIFK